MNVIEVKNLVKKYKDVAVVNELSFEVREGEFFAFLGENGAGKSTTISVICGLLKSDGGEVLVDGVASGVESIKNKIGVVFQGSTLDKMLSVSDNLKIRAALYGITGDRYKARIKELGSLLELDPLMKKPVGKLSGGQRRRIDVARALLHEPRILILDEPTTGLDPQTRRNIWEVIDGLRKKNNLTVFLTTHYMEEAAKADYVVIIDKGRKVAEGTPIELKTKYSGDYVFVYGDENLKLGGYECERIKGGVKLKVKDTEEAAKLILKHPEVFKDFEVKKGDMDDVFLSVTGKKLGGEQ